MEGHATPPEDDLGSRHQLRKNGDVVIWRGKLLAATLRGREAADLLRRIEQGDAAQAQQLMARLTGNYKRGNERKAQP